MSVCSIETMTAFQAGAAAAIATALVSLGAWRVTLRYQAWRARRSELEEMDVEQQLTFADAEAAQDAKAEMLVAMEARNKEWMAGALAKFHELKGRLPADFIGEDVRMLLIKVGGIEHRKNSWGAFINYLGQRGHIIRTGDHRAMKEEGTNAKESRVYRLREEVAA